MGSKAQTEKGGGGIEFAKRVKNGTTRQERRDVGRRRGLVGTWQSGPKADRRSASGPRPDSSSMQS